MQLIVFLVLCFVVGSLTEENEEVRVEKSNSRAKTESRVPHFIRDTDWKHIGHVGMDASAKTFAAAKVWGNFVYLVSVPCLKCICVIGEALAPHFKSTGLLMVAYLRKQPTHVLLQWLLGLVGVVVCYRRGYIGKLKAQIRIGKEKVQGKYQSGVRVVHRKSKAAGLLLPHVLYWILIIVLVRVCPSGVTNLWMNETVLAFLIVLVPICLSCKAIFRNSMESSVTAVKSPGLKSPKGRKSSAKKVPQTAPAKMGSGKGAGLSVCLRYWILWGMAVCIGGFLSFFCTQRMQAYIVVPVKLSVPFMLWLHLPWTQGSNVLYNIVSPIVNPYANKIGRENNNERANSVFSAMSILRIFPESRVHFLKDMWAQGPAVFGLMFLFAPGFLTYRGCLLIGMALPAYISIGLVESRETRNMEWWLVYFVVLSVVEYLVNGIGAAFSWLPFFYHAKLILILWLQFPYFRGAQKIFNVCASIRKQKRKVD